MKRFTKEELTFLEGLIGEVPRKKIAQRFNTFCKENNYPLRDEKVIMNKCEKVFGSLVPTDNYLSSRALSRYLGMKQERISNWIKRGLLKPQRAGRNYTISINVFKRFGLKHPNLISDLSREMLMFIYNDENIVENILAYSDTKKLDKSPKKVLHLYSGKVYNSIRQASIETNTARSSIRYWLKKNEIWKYAD
jgi:hypothetical protein